VSGRDRATGPAGSTPNGRRPEAFIDPGEVATRIVEHVGPRLVVATPLGLGKANRTLDALYALAIADPDVELQIVTALGLAPPAPASELERRLVEPVTERLFGGYPVPRFEDDLRRDRLPPNVTVRSFFFEPGSALRSRHAQRHHVSVDYSAVATVIRDAGVNVLAQLVAPGDGHVSLSCNPDLTHEALAALDERRAGGVAGVAVAEVNRNLPYMGGEAEVPDARFELVLDSPGDAFPLVGPPKQPLAVRDHMIGLHASTLVRDGGTLQLGIGTLADAVIWMLRLRHCDNPAYRALLTAAGGTRTSGLADEIGGTAPFARGLYANSEMLVDGFLDLLDVGVLRRPAYDDIDTQRHADEAPPGSPPPPGGHVIHAAFFLGPQTFYERLRALPDDERARIAITRVAFTNTLDGDRALKVAQRRDARFLNSALQVALDGATLSDAVEPGKVISGVGGQADFVRMAHALPDGRAVTLLRATRDADRVTSTIVWDHHHATVPRQERDVVVTEYGVADLRGRDAGQVAAALVEVADARFQDELMASARDAGLLPTDHEVSDRARGNTPARLAEDVASHRAHLPELPFGSELTADEVALGKALRHVDHLVRGRRWRDVGAGALRAAASPPAAATPYLARMGLDDPSSWRERAWQRVVSYGLAATGALDGAIDGDLDEGADT
jgi:hypothetical protein